MGLDYVERCRARVTRAEAQLTEVARAAAASPKGRFAQLQRLRGGGRRGDDAAAGLSHAVGLLCCAANGERGQISMYDLSNALEAVVLAGGSVDSRGWCGQTALQTAAQAGFVGGLRFLLSQGAVPHRANPRGWSPLCLAAHQGHSAAVQVLLSHSAEVGGEAAGDVCETIGPMQVALEAR
jgi:hypothetical protein